MSKDFLGRGLSFPIRVDKSTGKIKMVFAEDDIKESIRIILGTKKGERVMRPDFGSKLNEFIFESVDATTLFLIEEEVKSAITNWEPRVEDVSVKASLQDHSDGRVDIKIEYRVRMTNNLFNLVYPFYLKEGKK
ncbi:MAG: GPW/gp25 family protein [Peptostreptococcaceae bacterium]|jgi:phage baseplate assembly protein W|nr:GPW/gp25 family protein [Peptostreptococcaceae bacterium]